MASVKLAPFTEVSVGGYMNRRGTVPMVAAGPGLIVAGTHVRRHSAHAVPPSVNSAIHFCIAICVRPAVPPLYATAVSARNALIRAASVTPHCAIDARM